MNRSYLFCILFTISCTTFAFPCYLTVIKSACWNDYKVNVRMLDVTNEKVLATTQIPEDIFWARESFECTPKQTFRFETQFSPAIWQGDEGKVYKGKRYWSLPASTENAAAWNMTLCYPDDFAGLPSPDNAIKCGCDKSLAPPITPPQKKSS